jgi:hypothetical protein
MPRRVGQSSRSPSIGKDSKTAGDQQDFYGRISKLLKELKPLLLRVTQCAGAASEIKDLRFQRDQKQREFNELAGRIAQIESMPKPLSMEHSDEAHDLNQQTSACKAEIDALDKSISEKHKPFIDTDAEARQFIAAVRDALDYAPANSSPIKEIRSEIERLQLFGIAKTPGPLAMGLLRDELPKLRNRLAEFLGLAENPQSTLPALAEDRKQLSLDANESGRAHERKTFLDAKLAGKYSIPDLAKPGKISYNTIQSWLTGKVTTRTQYVRRRIADRLNALGISCEFPEVPE